MLNIKTMKTNCWIGPLIAVILLLTLRHQMYEFQNEQQQTAIPAKKKVIEFSKEVLRNEVKEKETVVQIGVKLTS